jgi:putative ABC transport system permease protein
MKSRDSFELAARNLGESKLRNSLTTIGIAVGVASLVAMLSLGIGLQQLFSKRLTNSGLFNTIWVFPQPRENVGPGGRRQQSKPPVDVEPRKVIDDSTRAELQRLPHVVEVYPELRFSADVRVPDLKASRTAQVRALPMSARDTDAIKEMQGKYFSADDADEVILRTNVAKDLSSKPEELIGKRVTLRYPERQKLANPSESDASEASIVGWGFAVVPRSHDVTIIGIVEKEPLAIGPTAGVFMPIGLARKLHPARPGEFRDTISRDANSSAGGETYNSMVVRVEKPTNVKEVEDTIKKMGFGSFSILDAANSLRLAFGVLDLFLGVFGSLALAVASLGIVNTLVMAILERRREIGIMKALGASDGDVRSLFFGEAATMGLFGGSLGVLLGWLIGRAINAATNIYLSRQDLPKQDIWSVPWWLVLTAVVFSILVSLFAGLYPAGRAARLDPVQALRYE